MEFEQQLFDSSIAHIQIFSNNYANNYKQAKIEISSFQLYNEGGLRYAELGGIPICTAHPAAALETHPLILALT